MRPNEFHEITPRELRLMVEAHEDARNEAWIMQASLALWVRPAVWGDEPLDVWDFIPWLKPKSAEEQEEARQEAMWEQVFSMLGASPEDDAH